MPNSRRLEVKEIGGATVAHFCQERITDPLEIEELGRELYRVLEQYNCSRLVLDFSGVAFLSSATLGKLLSLQHRIGLAHGKMRLCGIRREITQVFHICNLDRVFDIRDTQAEAIASFQDGNTPRG